MNITHLIRIIRMFVVYSSDNDPLSLSYTSLLGEGSYNVKLCVRFM